MFSRTIVLNGRPASISVADEAHQLLYALREQLGQQGPKFGCGVAQCGACTVIVDGVPIRSCVARVDSVPEGATVRTLDGLADRSVEGEVELHTIQKTFIEEQAAQCAFCINGMVMGSLAWIEARHAAGNMAVPTREEVADYLSGATSESTFNYLCRCGAHNRIIDAVRSAAKRMAS